MATSRFVVNRDGYITVDDHLCHDSCELFGLERDEFERRLRAAVFNIRSPGEKLRAVSFKLPVWLLELVDREVQRRGLSHRSELIRDALTFYLMKQDSVLAIVKRLRDLYAARGFLYAIRPLLAFAKAYLDDEILRSDIGRVEEELEAAIKHVEDELARLHKALGLW